MNSNCKHLFIYGTLLSSDNEFGAFLKSNSVWFAKGSFPGLLYDMGEYPGAVYNPDIAGKVYGDIVELNDDTEVLKKIDEYEGFGENEEQPNLFIRKMIPITTDAGVIVCWVYLYNLPVDDYRQIASGRYTITKSSSR